MKCHFPGGLGSIWIVHGGKMDGQSVRSAKVYGPKIWTPEPSTLNLVQFWTRIIVVRVSVHKVSVKCWVFRFHFFELPKVYFQKCFLKAYSTWKIFEIFGFEFKLNDSMSRTSECALESVSRSKESVFFFLEVRLNGFFGESETWDGASVSTDARKSLWTGEWFSSSIGLEDPRTDHADLFRFQIFVRVGPKFNFCSSPGPAWFKSDPVRSTFLPVWGSIFARKKSILKNHVTGPRLIIKVET